MRPWLSLFAALFAGVAAANAAAAELRLEVEIPRMAVAEYHAPYLAFWLKHADSGEIVPLGLWYDDQEKWLKDLRLWWRRTGRGQSRPYDGLTGATRRPGTHSVDFSELPALSDLPEGDYQLVVEAAREVGGREVVRLPFQWPATGNKTVRADGEQELGRVQLRLAP
ncbi:DUF2271 domain-containing protein [Alloalcanivorax venustensis]|jgi:hypothetical protein|uniref:DUF2271 domain-containing protein n=1 Tax=Alloalcanivorax TaxID=3020832 RepID=UPI000EE27B90|nr:DUF2271 domain-containing protein [Alcanivorax sp.]MED5602456.1 DUF2271 domain-containing protein [Pseudomonadota bacterium]SMO80012.1 Hypothetical protein SAMN06272769_11431 [Alcanivorax sp. DSM 26295]HCO65115.1 DUF2271 domain-containing protein [Alcanivorax sp.]|tara:strand:+ start:51 stop:551 length:501 start_codon:yes stop_codon:yes gene_type:complete